MEYLVITPQTFHFSLLEGVEEPAENISRERASVRRSA